MGIHCEISLSQPIDVVYKPGTIVSGNIKFVVDKVTEFTKITVSLKGYCLLRIDEKYMRNNGHGSQKVIVSHLNKEEIVDLDTGLKGEDNKTFTMSVGSEVMHFHFKLPVHIPPSLKYVKYQVTEDIYCKIFYYVRVKFNRPGLFERTKRYKKEIPVVSGMIPALPREPTIYGEKKTLTNVFSCKNHVINMKAVIEDSVIETGGKVRFNCQVENLTNIKIQGLKIMLLEVYTFVKQINYKTKVVEYVKNTDLNTRPIKSGRKESLEFIIDVPNDRVSLEHSQIISRKYYVRILAQLPFPHKNFDMEIPLQIGNIIESEMHMVPIVVVHTSNLVDGGASDADVPPTYWEAMSEEKGDLFEDIVDEAETQKK